MLTHQSLGKKPGLYHLNPIRLCLHLSLYRKEGVEEMRKLKGWTGEQWDCLCVQVPVSAPCPVPRASSLISSSWSKCAACCTAHGAAQGDQSCSGLLLSETLITPSCVLDPRTPNVLQIEAGRPVCWSWLLATGLLFLWQAMKFQGPWFHF